MNPPSFTIFHACDDEASFEEKILAYVPKGARLIRNVVSSGTYMYVAPTHAVRTTFRNGKKYMQNNSG